MKTILIDDDLHAYLLRNIKEIGEDASTIIRRLLNLPKLAGSPPKEGLQENQSQLVQKTTPMIDECLSNPRFQMQRDAVGRFLFILSWLCKKHPKDFSKVLNLRGRVRNYFGTSASAIEERGNSVFPQKIPDSSYWVVTNNDTPKKERMLQDVMRLLGYTRAEAYRLCDALE